MDRGFCGAGSERHKRPYLSGLSVVPHQLPFIGEKTKMYHREDPQHIFRKKILLVKPCVAFWVFSMCVHAGSASGARERHEPRLDPQILWRRRRRCLIFLFTIIVTRNKHGWGDAPLQRRRVRSPGPLSQPLLALPLVGWERRGAAVR